MYRSRLNIALRSGLTAILVLGLGACQMMGGGDRTAEPTTPTAGQMGGGQDTLTTNGTEPAQVSISQLAQNMDAYANRSIQTTGRLAQVLDDRAYTIDTGRTMGTTEIYVVNTSDATSQLSPGDRVQIKGTVRRLSMNELRQTYGVDLREEVIANWLDRPVIIADEVKAAD